MALRIPRAAGWMAVVALAAGAAVVTTPDGTTAPAPVVQVAQAKNAIAPLAPQQLNIDRLLMTAPR